MPTRVRVKFDGKVLVPQEPVDLTVGREFEVDLPETSPTAPAAKTGLQRLAEKLAAYPPAELPADYSTQIDHYLYGTPKRNDP